MTHRSNGGARVPDLVVERYRLGEMTPEEIAAFERRLFTDAELGRRLRMLDASDRELRRSYPPSWLAAGVTQRLGARSAARRHAAVRWPLGMRWRTLSAVTGVLLLALLARPLLRPSVDEAADRVKGLEPTLLLFRKVPSGSTPLQDGAVTRPGDLIRIGYRAAGHPWGMILSVDGRGVVTVHLPRGGTRAAQLSQGAQVLLDFAYELDDAPRWERFYFVAGSEPFDAAPVIEAARRAAAMSRSDPPAGLSLRLRVKQSSVLLIKEVVP